VRGAGFAFGAVAGFDFLDFAAGFGFDLAGRGVSFRFPRLRSTVSNARDKYGGMPRSPRSHRATVLDAASNSAASCSCVMSSAMRRSLSSSPFILKGYSL
jgi:hypothetical protein